MEARDEALSLVEGSDRIGTGCKRQREVQIGRFIRVPLQQSQGDFVTRTQGQKELPLIARIGQDVLQIRSQSLDVRLHAGACAPFSP